MSYGFLHTSDIHLNMKFDNKGFSLKEREKRRSELWSAFDKILETSKSGIKYIFISGDTIQQEYCSFSDIRHISEAFAGIGDVRIVMTCGSNDPWGINNMYGYVDWPDNVYIIKNTDTLEHVCFEDDGICIYALSQREMQEDETVNVLYEAEIDDDKINVLIVSGFEGIETDKIKDKFDYCAMGGSHNYCRAADNVVCPGTPEPLSFDEEGEHGIVRGILSKDSTTSEFIPIAKRKFIIREIELTAAYDFNKILDLIKFSGDTFSNIKDYVRIKLTGSVNSDISIEEIKNEAGQFFYYIEFEEDYVYKNKINKIYQGSEYTIIESYKMQFDKLEANDRIQQKAFELGLDVMRKEKVVG